MSHWYQFEAVTTTNWTLINANGAFHYTSELRFSEFMTVYMTRNAPLSWNSGQKVGMAAQVTNTK